MALNYREERFEKDHGFGQRIQWFQVDGRPIRLQIDLMWFDEHPSSCGQSVSVRPLPHHFWNRTFIYPDFVGKRASNHCGDRFEICGFGGRIHWIHLDGGWFVYKSYAVLKISDFVWWMGPECSNTYSGFVKTAMNFSVHLKNICGFKKGHH